MFDPQWFAIMSMMTFMPGAWRSRALCIFHCFQIGGPPGNNPQGEAVVRPPGLSSKWIHNGREAHVAQVSNCRCMPATSTMSSVSSARLSPSFMPTPHRSPVPFAKRSGVIRKWHPRRCSLGSASATIHAVRPRFAAVVASAIGRRWLGWIPADVQVDERTGLVAVPTCVFTPGSPPVPTATRTCTMICTVSTGMSTHQNGGSKCSKKIELGEGSRMSS